MRRSTVDFPQPDGPRIVTNSPWPGRSGTEKVTSRITVKSPNRFVTPRNSTMLGSVGHSSPARYGKEAALEAEQQPVDPVGEQADDHQDQEDVLRQAAPLTGHQQIAEAVLALISSASMMYPNAMPKRCRRLS